MQNYTEIPSSTSLSDSLPLILANDKTVMSNNAGTAFPTVNLQPGMLCFRTDENKVYQLKQATPSAVWVLLFDLSGATPTAPRASTAATADSATTAGTAGSATTAGTASALAAGATVGTTPSADDNSTKVASTAFVLGQASNTAPLPGGTAAAGTSPRFARADHVHPGTNIPVLTTVVIATSGTFTVPAGVFRIKATVMAAGGGGGLSPSAWGGAGLGGPGATGGAGGLGQAIIDVTPGQTISCTVPGPTSGATDPANAGNGGTCSFGSYITCTGGTGATGGGVNGSYGGFLFTGYTPGGAPPVAGTNGTATFGSVAKVLLSTYCGSGLGGEVYSGRPGGFGLSGYLYYTDPDTGAVGYQGNNAYGGGGGGAGFGGGGGGGGGPANIYIGAGYYGYGGGGGGGGIGGGAGGAGSDSGGTAGTAGTTTAAGEGGVGGGSSGAMIGGKGGNGGVSNSYGLLVSGRGGQGGKGSLPQPYYTSNPGMWAYGGGGGGGGIVLEY